MCGIFGIVNRHKRQLDKRAFITLGCANDSRGGDACGIMIDRKVEKGTAKEDQYFQNWYSKSEVLMGTEKCYVAFGHCRKASVGGVAPDKAQPVTIEDKDGNILFCLIHNGTIYNYKELAEKYIPDVDIKDLTDSQVMARIFFYAGYDVLKEYNGGGAFVIQDYRTNKTLMFKGESKGSLNATTTVEERPLYFVRTGKSVIFSSIFSVLQGLYWGFVTYDVPSNVLLECDGDNIYKVKDYDRSKCYGCKQYANVKSSTGGTTSWNYGYSGYYGSSWNRVRFNPKEGVYIDSVKKTKLHGVIHVGSTLYISQYKTSYNETYYFWNGIMLSGENAYNAVRDFSAEKNTTSKEVMCLARMLSCNPIMINNRYYMYDKSLNKIPYSDTYSFPLSETMIYCDPKGRVLVTYEVDDLDKFVPANISKENVNKIVDYVKKSIQRNC